MIVEKLKFGAILIISLVLFLLTLKKEKQKADWLLLVWCIFFGIHLITINYTSVLPQVWFYLNEVIGYLHGFMLYHYIRLHSKESISIRSSLAQALALVLGGIIILIISGSNYWQHPLLIVSMKGLASGLYITITLIYLSNSKIFHRNWHLFLTIGLSILVLFPIISAWHNSAVFISNQNAVGNIAYCLFIVLLGFLGIGLVPVFVNEYPINKESKSLKYASSKLSEDQRTQIFNMLDKLINEERLFTYTDLNLGIISDRLGYNSNKISESINYVAKCNFNDYINHKRVSAVKLKIENGEHHTKTLLALAFESGFNSKTSFNRAFRKHTKKTPSQFVSTIS